jgi:hypothetical protein
VAYKTFVAGEEALAADVNSYLMGQTVARFASAAARTSALAAPALNQLSMLDTRPGVVQFWNGSAWTDIPTYWERSFLVTPNLDLPPSAANAHDLTFTAGATGAMMFNGFATIQWQAAGQQQITALVHATSLTPPTTRPDSYLGGNLAALAVHTVPIFAQWNAITAGQSCGIKVYFASTPGPAVKVISIFGSYRISSA